MAEALLRQHAWTSQMVELRHHPGHGSAQVVLLDPPGFSRRYRLAQRRELHALLRQHQHDIDGERHESNKAALVRQQRALRRRAAIWAPSSARRFLGGIELEDGSVARSEQDIQRALANYWRG
eukprot:5009181-Pyramimonas_sp.AAC.1